MASRDIKDLDPVLQPIAQEFLDQCAAVGLKVFLIQTYRSSEEQDADYQQGRSVPGHVITNAKGGESAHNCVLADGTPASRAYDFGIYAADGKSLDWDASDQDWQTAIGIGKSLGLVSGSTFHGIPDSDHLELANWQSYPSPWPLPATSGASASSA